MRCSHKSRYAKGPTLLSQRFLFHIRFICHQTTTATTTTTTRTKRLYVASGLNNFRAPRTSAKNTLTKTYAHKAWGSYTLIFCFVVSTLLIYYLILFEYMAITQWRTFFGNFGSSLRKLCLREKKNFEILVSEYSELSKTSRNVIFSWRPDVCACVRVCVRACVCLCPVFKVWNPDNS